MRPNQLSTASAKVFEKIRTMRPYPHDMLRLSRRALIAGGVATVFGLPALAQQLTAGRVETVHGDVVAEAQSVRRPLAPASEIFVGDTVITAEQSHVGMRLGTVTAVNLGAEARLRIERLAGTTGGSLELAAGAALIDRQEADRKDILQLRSPFGLIAARGTKFFAGSSYGVFGVFVLRGEVTVAAAGQTVVLRTEQGSEIRKPGHHPSAPRRWSSDRVAAALASVSHA
jgi:hypothetical protein